MRVSERLHALDDGALAVGGGRRPEGADDVWQVQHREQGAREDVREGRLRHCVTQRRTMAWSATAR